MLLRQIEKKLKSEGTGTISIFCPRLKDKWAEFEKSATGDLSVCALGFFFLSCLFSASSVIIGSLGARLVSAPIITSLIINGALSIKRG